MNNVREAHEKYVFLLKHKKKTGKCYAQDLVREELFFLSLFRNMSILEAIPHYGDGKHPLY